ncbi:MAG TPA: L-threonylcarbamoyladenylate synthase [Ignavibacteriaceae bacterium]|nr:L-threonylcarbamoyladenylate synthase [Ignavibacteriaceae bacterium]
MSEKKAEIINIDYNIDEAVQRAKKLYTEGKVFIYPTDTIYGFGSNPFNKAAVERIVNIKGREDEKKFILLIDTIQNMLKYAELKSEKQIDFLLSIWPNPVSVILKLSNEAKNALGQEDAAFRIPDNKFCYKLLSDIKLPLISTSANRTGEEPILEHKKVIDEFALDVDAIFFTEKEIKADASTIIRLSDKPELIREGVFKFEEIIRKYK